MALVNQRGDILLTSLPVADLSQPAPRPIFPQIADGGRFQTETIFISPEKSVVSATPQDCLKLLTTPAATRPPLL
jgi:hypothetical protein